MAASYSHPVMPIEITRAVTADRTRDIGLLFGLLAWLVYTRFFLTLRAGHLVLPPCPFYYLTGHPCPFCGGTRAFAYMWEGDISDAVRLYPLGPALFAGTVVTVGGLAAGIVTGRTWTPRLSALQWKLVGVFAVSLVLVSWALKW